MQVNESHVMSIQVKSSHDIKKVHMIGTISHLVQLRQGHGELKAIDSPLSSFLDLGIQTHDFVNAVVHPSLIRLHREEDCLARKHLDSWRRFL